MIFNSISDFQLIRTIRDSGRGQFQSLRMGSFPYATSQKADAPEPNTSLAQIRFELQIYSRRERNEQ